MTLPTAIGNIMNKDVGDFYEIGGGKVTNLGGNKYQWTNPYGQSNIMSASDPYTLAQTMYNGQQFKMHGGQGRLTNTMPVCSITPSIRRQRLKPRQ